MKWLGKNKNRKVIKLDWQALTDAIEQARGDWQLAQQLLDVTEARDVDHSIYYLHVTEKRYMYLLDQAKALYEKKRALEA